MKAGAAGTRGGDTGACTRAAHGVAAGLGRLIPCERVREGAGSCHQARGEGPHAGAPRVLCQGEPRGDMLVVQGQLGPPMPPLRLQAAGAGGWQSSARGLCPTTKPIRGCVVPLGRGCTPKAAWLHPPARLNLSPGQL